MSHPHWIKLFIFLSEKGWPVGRDPNVGTREFLSWKKAIPSAHCIFSANITKYESKTKKGYIGAKTLSKNTTIQT